MPLTRRQMLQRQRNTIQSFKEKMQDMREFLHGLDSFTQGQVKVKEVDWERLQYIILGVTPNAGPYRGGEYPFKLIPGSNEVEFLAEMFHPNIDKGQICIDQDDVRYTLDRTTIGILNTLHEPQYYDVSSLTFHQVCNGQSMARIYRTTRLALTGRPIGSLQCPRYIEDDEEILDFLKEIESEKQRRLHSGTATVAQKGQLSLETATVAQEGQHSLGTSTVAQEGQCSPGTATVAQKGQRSPVTTTVAQKWQISQGTTTVAQQGELSLETTTVAQKGQSSLGTITVAQEGHLSNGATGTTSDETQGRNVNKTG